MKAKVITIGEIKGGTGKTTTALALAQASQKDNKKVLLIDLDPQGNLSNLVGADTTEPGAVELLAGYPVEELIQRPNFPTAVDIIAGNADLSNETTKKGSLYRLERAIQPLLSKYNLIIIDTPPARCEMTYNALQASNGLIITLDADISSLQGFYLITDLVKDAKQHNSKLKLLGAIITRYNGRPVLSQKLKSIIEEQANKLKCPYLGEVRQGIAIQEAQAYRANLFDYAPKSKPAQDYKDIYNKLFK